MGVKRETEKRQWSGLVFLAPALLLYLAVIIVPALQTVNLSFWKWDGVNASTWVGWRNYADVLTDPTLRGSIGHALFLILFFCVLPVAMGLIMAALMTRQRRQRGMAVFRLIFFLPQVLPLVAVGIIWRWVYAPSGILNQILGWFGITTNTGWLGSWNWALPALGLIGAWVQSGLTMMLFLAGVGSIDPELYEAVRLDGAGAVREFFTVTLPGLRTQVSLALTVTVISALASFDLVYVTTSGGPYYRTAVPGLLVYQNLIAGDIGHAAALAIVLSLTVLLAAVVASRVSYERDDNKVRRWGRHRSVLAAETAGTVPAVPGVSVLAGAGRVGPVETKEPSPLSQTASQGPVGGRA